MLEKEKKRPRKKTSPAAPASIAAGSQMAASSSAGSTIPARLMGRPEAISAEERRRMVAEAAYFRAQRRGFRGGDPDRDWIEAEVEIDALLLNRR